MRDLSELTMKTVIWLGMCILPQLVFAENVYETFPAQFNLVSLNGQNGFAINGINSKDNSGYSISGAGDFIRSIIKNEGAITYRFSRFINFFVNKSTKLSTAIRKRWAFSIKGTAL